MKLHEHAISLNSVEADQKQEKKLWLICIPCKNPTEDQTCTSATKHNLKPLSKSFHLPLHASLLSARLQNTTKGQCPHGSETSWTSSWKNLRHAFLQWFISWALCLTALADAHGKLNSLGKNYIYTFNNSAKAFVTLWKNSLNFWVSRILT